MVETQTCTLQGPFSIRSAEDLNVFCESPCDTIAHSVSISAAEDITDLRAFSRIEVVEGRFTIAATPSLRTLGGLNRLVSVGRFGVSSLDGLVDVSAMYGAEIDTLNVAANSSLGDCEVAELVASTIPRSFDGRLDRVFETLARCEQPLFARVVDIGDPIIEECPEDRSRVTSFYIEVSLENPSGVPACFAMELVPVEDNSSRRLGLSSDYRLRMSSLAGGPCSGDPIFSIAEDRIGGAVEVVGGRGDEPERVVRRLIMSFQNARMLPFVEPALVEFDVTLDPCP